MIRSAKEARETIKHDPGDLLTGDQHREYGVAEGYLAALQGPEVKALVEIVETVKEAFAQYREAVKS